MSPELGITAARAAQWRDQFLAAGQASLKSRAPDAWDEANRRLQAKIEGERFVVLPAGSLSNPPWTVGGRPALKLSSE